MFGEASHRNYAVQMEGLVDSAMSRSTIELSGMTCLRGVPLFALASVGLQVAKVIAAALGTSAAL